jgi:hypothetical protein
MDRTWRAQGAVGAGLDGLTAGRESPGATRQSCQQAALVETLGVRRGLAWSERTRRGAPDRLPSGEPVGV